MTCSVRKVQRAILGSIVGCRVEKRSMKSDSFLRFEYLGGNVQPMECAIQFCTVRYCIVQ
jgi:hypothetical protein